MGRLVGRAETIPWINGMSHNGRVVFFSEPFWAIPFNMITVYSSLYMQALGLTFRQIGLTQTLLVGTQIVSSLFSGFLTDKFGRKRTTLFFDMISWAAAGLVWAYSRSVIGFIIAAFLNGVNKVVYVSFSCMMTEGASSNQRLRNYSGLHFIILSCGIFAPLGGLVVDSVGLVEGTRLLYFYGALIMATMFILRHIGWNEPGEHPEQPIGGTVREFIKALRFFMSGSVHRRIFILQGINHFFILFKPLFYFIYLKNTARLGESALSLVPLIGSVITVIILLAFLPRLNNRRLRGLGLSVGYLLGVVSLLLLIASARFSFTVLWLSVILDAMSLALIRPLLDSLWADHLENRSRARQLSAGNFFFSLFAIPAGSLAAELYVHSPILPFAMASLLLLVSFLLSLGLDIKVGENES